MISYLQVAEKLVDKSIYGRGVKTFLEGGVVSFVNLTLDSWRKYQVKDLDTETVLIPLLHLALSMNKWNDGDKVLKESAICSCHYFHEFGPCKHIVAVCASLEQEFIRPNKLGSKKQEIESSLSALFEIGNNQEQREWLNKIYQYFERSKSSLFPWISQIVRQTSLEFENNISQGKNIDFQVSKYSEFWFGLKDLCVKATQDFDQEKKLIQLIADSLITGSYTWWSFWLDIFPVLHPTNQVKILTEIWFQSYTLQHKFQTELNDYIQNNNSGLNNKVMQKLEEYPNPSKLKVDLALQTKNKDWLEENIQILDPNSLINMAVNFPDLLEIIEINLSNILRVWTDFLTPQGTIEIQNIMQTWRNKLGDTMEYQNMKSYLKQSFPKRKKLWGEM